MTKPEIERRLRRLGFQRMPRKMHDAWSRGDVTVRLHRGSNTNAMRLRGFIGKLERAPRR